MGIPCNVKQRTDANYGASESPIESGASMFNRLAAGVFAVHISVVVDVDRLH